MELWSAFHHFESASTRSERRARSSTEARKSWRWLGRRASQTVIFVTTPKVAYGDAGFPLLQLPGEFLLKDLVLFAAGAAISAMAQTEELARIGVAGHRVPNA